MSSKQLTPEDLERMSPQALVEFMTENIPADKLRNCLSKVEEFPTELPMTIPDTSSETTPSSGAGSSGEPPMSQIDIIRNKCEKYPIIVSKIGPVAGQTGDFVQYYKRNKSGVFKLLADSVEKFDKKNCNPTDPTVTDVDCQQIAEWVESKMNDGVLDSSIKTVLQEYARNNKADFMTKCDNVSQLMVRLGITSSDLEEEPELELEPETFDGMSNQDKLKFLKTNCLYSSGIIFGNLVSGDPSKAVVYMSLKSKDYRWERFKIALDNIKNSWCEKVKRAPNGSEKYDELSVGYANSSSDIKREIRELISKLSSEGIEIPYDFLSAGGISD